MLLKNKSVYTNSFEKRIVSQGTSTLSQSTSVLSSGATGRALRMVSRKVVASLLLVSLLSVLAEQTQGFMPFFTQSDFQKMQEKERNKAGQKKSLSSLQQLEEEGFSEQSGVDVNAAKTLQQALPVRAWLTPRQLEKYQDVLEKLLAELLQDTPDAD
uniref:MOTI protein n=4 Tax=Passeriformes TaxID=9126 RepID=A0A8C5NT38_JUNHY